MCIVEEIYLPISSDEMLINETLEDLDVSNGLYNIQPLDNKPMGFDEFNSLIDQSFQNNENIV
jgi:hypothetical protein